MVVIMPMNKMVMKIKLSNILGFINLRQVVTYIDLHVALKPQVFLIGHKPWLMLTDIMEAHYLYSLGFCHKLEDVDSRVFCVHGVRSRARGRLNGHFGTCNIL